MQEKPFNNLESYNREMARPIEDKLFFLDKVAIHFGGVIVDFGCADGTLLDALHFRLGKLGVMLVGYDKNPAMLEAARRRWPHSGKGITFTDSLETVREAAAQRDSIVVLSSVMHEILSYCSPEEVNETLAVLNLFSTVVIRDMAASVDMFRPAETDMLQAVEEAAARDRGLARQLKEFQEHWGDTLSGRSGNAGLVQFLLKHRWTVNWQRELQEDYFALRVENIPRMFPGHNIDYLRRFRVPFLDEAIAREFGIGITDFTHVKAVLRKRHTTGSCRQTQTVSREGQKTKARAEQDRFRKIRM